MKKNYFKNLVNALLNKPPVEEPKYMFNTTNGVFIGNAGIVTSGWLSDGIEVTNMKDPPKDKRIPIKPIQVFQELERVPTRWSLEGVNEKIAILKDRLTLVQNNSTVKQELLHFLLCLENRKKYHAKDSKGELYSQFYAQFDTTTEEKIGDLLKAYALRKGGVDLFIPELPPEAIQIMKDFTDKTIELSRQKPNFSIIAEEKDFKEAEKKRDPILLAQSPFGQYYYILGAWDKEMTLLSEL